MYSVGMQQGKFFLVYSALCVLYFDHGSIVVIVPVEVEVFDSNAGGVGAGQKNCGTIHRFN